MIEAKDSFHSRKELFADKSIDRQMLLKCVMNLQIMFTSFSLCLKFIRICQKKKPLLSRTENLNTHTLYIFREIAKTKLTEIHKIWPYLIKQNWFIFAAL